VGWGLRGKAKRTFARTIAAMVPEPAVIAFSAMRRHKRFLGTYPNLFRPKTFSEKVLHRIVFDRRPILTKLQDKYAARDYVREKIGEHVLPRLYWATKTPADIPFDDLPSKFVVKATHGCGWNYLVPDKTALNQEDLIEKCESWLGRNYYYRSREWAYKHIEPRIIVEQFINDDTGPTPMDYKFYAFNGSAQFIWAIAGRSVEPRCTGYTPSWGRLAMKQRWKSIEWSVPRPQHLDEMIEYAEILGDGLDFVRVDFYDAGKVYFGEMTLYPSGGMEFYDPKWNRYFGRVWDSSLRAGSRNPRDPAKPGHGFEIVHKAVEKS
jgi:TupA-like ATPgrasp